MKSKPINTKLDLFPVAAGVWGLKDKFVNVFMVLNPDDNNWVLIDTGLKSSASKIRRMARLIFGEDARPSAIILTHGHFDHVGSVQALSEYWDVPVYAHHYEMPYLTGLSSYPPGDPTVRGGIMSDLAGFFPKTPINIESRLVALPEDGSVPYLPDWKFLHTPGHSAGHVSFFREKDKLLIAGDAVVTTKAESAWYTFLQIKIVSGPPKYFTSDWLSAAASAETLAALEPEILAAGHGKPMRGSGMRKSLHNLAVHFDKLAVPYHGRYVHMPALADDTGVVHLPPKNKRDISSPNLKIIAVSGAVLITWLLISNATKKSKTKKIVQRERKIAEEAEIENRKIAKRIELENRHLAHHAELENKKLKKKIQSLENAVAEKSHRVEKSTKKAVAKLPAWLDTLESIKFPPKKISLRKR